MSTKQRILIVDDTEANRYAVARILRASGFETFEAATGTEGLRLCREIKPDLVTLDIHLPDMLGFEVCRRIKTEAETAHIPVLQVSASFVTSKDRINGLEGGADSYLTHPFEPPVLVATVKALLRARRIDEELRLSEERFNVALSNAPIFMHACDASTRYTWVHGCPFGLSSRDFLNRRDEDIFAPEEAIAFGELKRKALREASGQRATLTLSLNGHARVFDFTVEPVRDRGQCVTGLTVAGVDITERVKAAEVADFANREKTRFLSHMSHEIRTPLGVIQGFAELALDENLPAPEIRGHLRTIQRNAVNLGKLLGDILDLTKVEAGRIDVERARFDLPDLIEDVIETLRLASAGKNVTLNVKIAPAVPRGLKSDPTRVRQILVNVISNAIKFTAGGEVTVSADFAEDRATIEVADTGIGLSAEQVARLFSPFTQGDSSTTRRFGGTGLGLHLSRNLARALGGDVELVDSQLGKGSRFRITFQAEVVEPPVRATIDGPSRAGRLAGMRVLLVEDSPDNQMLFCAYLKQTGAVVELAGDGIEGIAKATDAEYDVILMDVQMPRLDGIEATTRLRKGGVSTPIVALTAHALREERERAMKIGFDDYLTKPLRPGQLVETLARFV